METTIVPEVLSDTEIRHLDAETRMFEAQARNAELQNIIYENEVGDRLAGDEFKGTYGFYTVIAPNAVEKAMTVLSRWSRKEAQKPITVTFNSPGGVVTEGFALYDFLRDLSNQGHPITTRCLGAAASMGAILMQAGDTRIMTPNAFMMVHEISGLNEGTVAEMKDTIAIVNRFQEKALDILLKRATISRTKLKQMWTKTDWYLDAKDALKYGFVDKIAE